MAIQRGLVLDRQLVVIIPRCQAVDIECQFTARPVLKIPYYHTADWGADFEKTFIGEAEFYFGLIVGSQRGRRLINQLSLAGAFNNKQPFFSIQQRVNRFPLARAKLGLRIFSPQL